MKQTIIAIVCSLLIAPLAVAQELQRWQGSIDEVSFQSKYLLVSDNPFVMGFSMTVKTHEGQSLDRFALKQGQLVEISYEVKRNASQSVKAIVIYPDNHVFSNNHIFLNEDDE